MAGLIGGFCKTLVGNGIDQKDAPEMSEHR